MFIYYTIFFFAIVLVWITNHGNSRGSNRLYSRGDNSRSFRTRRRPLDKGALAVSALILIVVAGFRDGVGSDFYSIYVEHFFQIESGYSPDWEVGFTWLNKVVLRVTSDYHWLFFICAFITVTLTYVAVTQTSTNAALSIFIFCFGGFYFFSLNGIRQSIAIALFLLSISAIRSRNLIKYLTIILLASFFHISSLALILLYPIINGTKRISVLSLLGLIVGLPLLSSTSFLSLLPTKYAEKFITGIETFSGNPDLQDLLLCSIPFFLYLFVSRDSFNGPENESDNTIKSYLMISGIGLTCAILSSAVFIMYRMAAYFSAALILIIPELLSRIRDGRLRQLLTFFIVGILIALTQYLFGVQNQSDVLPYKSVLRF